MTVLKDIVFIARNTGLFNEKLYSPKQNQSFYVQDAKIQIVKEQDKPDRFRLSLNVQNILNWFGMIYKEVKLIIRLHINPQKKMEVVKNKDLKRY